MFDVVIIGAGLSGIAAACYLQRECPERSFCILEARRDLGGTWALFQYPGIRSDSPMVVFSFAFKPFKLGTQLGEGAEIRDYLCSVADENGVTDNVRFGHRVTRQSWSSQTQMWTLDVDVTGTAEDSSVERVQIECGFVIACTGYYDYDNPFNPKFPGQEDYRGEVIHPQLWPKDADVRGKRVVVVGSGATAVTLVPELAKEAEHVVVVQRSPTYITVWPRALDGWALWYLRAVESLLGAARAHTLWRWLQIRMEYGIHALCMRCPSVARRVLWGVTAWFLGDKAETLRPHLTPRYDPWTQRLCLDADGDYLKSLRDGNTTIVTSALEGFTRDGVRLASGQEIPCDVVVTALGLNLVSTPGKMEILVDGERPSVKDQFTYRGVMFTGLPNFIHVMGYLNTSWTLRAEELFGWACRLLNFMQENKHEAVVPTLRECDRDMERHPFVEGFNPSYFNRVIDDLASQGDTDPWRFHTQDVFADKASLSVPIGEDGALQFS